MAEGAEFPGQRGDVNNAAAAATHSVPQGSSSISGGSDPADSAHRRREKDVSANCASESSITTRWPMAAPVAPAPAKADSRTVTWQPALASASAQAAPTMPAPTTIAEGALIEPW